MGFGLIKGSAVIVENATNHKGIDLDRMDVTGPRGGKASLWRRVDMRNNWIALWHETKSSAIAA